MASFHDKPNHKVTYNYLLMKFILALTVAAAAAFPALAQRSDTALKNWEFSKDSTSWQNVTIPHDWAIYGPFDRKYDLQNVAVEQNGETEKTWKTGRTGGLPYIGKGFYKTTVNIPDTAGRSNALVFDGAMSNAHVYVNGHLAAFWPYGYNSFYVNLDGLARPGENNIEVSLENKPQSSRWYPGAGLYRNVHLVSTDRVHIPVWGTILTTPYVSKEYATVMLRTELEGVSKGEDVTLSTLIKDASGKTVVSDRHDYKIYPGVDLTQNFVVRNPSLWTPETPALYTAETSVIKNGKTVDSYSTRFGIRSVEVRNGEGFFLNGEKRQFKGVCNHHDLGPLGAAVNKAALRHQLEMLKEMGADAVRTAHNMPTPELVELCDEIGLMMMIEPFDDWGFRPKSKNGYGSIFNEWAEKDMVNMLRHYRNNPSVVMWSIGNEVPSQWGPDGISELKFLQDIVHREDPTRPVTCGMDQVDAVISNGFAAALDVPGFNYRVHRYKDAYPKLPQNILLGSETASTVSSRGKYFFPVEYKPQVTRPGNQSSSYDTEYCSWSNIPDDDFAAADDLPYDMGQFVWTGFDYLGEPSPYDTDAWPSHSSYFGIIDLASIPKDRYYLYRSKWNEKDHTLHILPHWNWKGREGEITPVFVYTNYPSAELFINGKSQGRRTKDTSIKVTDSGDQASLKNLTRQNRYRLMWMDTRYEPGTVKVVAYDENNNAVAEQKIRTAGSPHHLEVTADRTGLKANGKDLAFITVKVVDKNGNLCPDASHLIHFKVKGAGSYRAAANGDATCIFQFHKPEMPAFKGMLTAIVQSSEIPGNIRFEATAKGLKSGVLELESKK